MSDHEELIEKLGAHYNETFEKHGATEKGVDWGPDPADHILRLDRMLAVADRGFVAQPSLLDVGCGYGSLYERMLKKGDKLSYTGVDLSNAMIELARARHPEAKWMACNVLDLPSEPQADYVVCNGVLTQKLSNSQSSMDAFLKRLVKHMYAMARVGIAFNVMSTHVNFTADNLYYRNPAELLGWCMSEVTPRVRLDHAYPLYEYTLYLYRPDAAGIYYGSHREGSQL